jgi:hypothetical protein
MLAENNEDQQDEAAEDEPELDEYGRPMPKYSDRELQSIINTELDNALGSQGSEISEIRLRNLQFYKAEPIGELLAPDIPDRSSLVSSDVADTVDGMIPQLMRMFVSSDAVDCEAKRQEFERGAKQVKEYLNHLFFKKNNGFNVLYSMFKDAFIQKVGFAKVWWEDTLEDAVEQYDSLTEAQLIMLTQDSGVSLTNSTPRMIDVGGQQMQVFDVQVKRQKKSGKACVSTVPPEEMRIHRHAIYGQEPLFIAQERYVTRGELEAMGYDADDYSSDENVSSETLERQSLTNNFYSLESTEELQRFRFCEAYIKLDQNNDGVAELLKCTLISEELVDVEQVDDHPFIDFCPIPSTHVYFGDCPADRALEPQRLNTSLIRAIADNAYLSVNNRHALLENQVNMDDYVDSRPGGGVRVKSMGAIQPLPQGGLDPASWKLVEWGQQWNERRTGFYRASAGLQSDAINKTAYGVAVQINKQDAQIELIARLAAESVRKIFTKMLRLISMYQNIPETVKLTGGWADVNPREWHNQFTVSVNVGLGTGNRDERAQHGNMLLQILKQFVEGGIYDSAPAIAVARDIAKAVGYDKPELIFPDAKPPTPPAPPPPDPRLQIEQQKIAADAQRMQQEALIHEKDAALNHAREMERIKLETESKERIAMAEITAKQQQSLLELASGVLAAQHNTSGQVTNLVNGTQLDQSAQAPGFTLDDLHGVMSQIGALASAISNPPPRTRTALMPDGSQIQIQEH